MSTPRTPIPDRLYELLVAQACEALSPAETLELERLLAAHPDVDRRGYDEAAGAIMLEPRAGMDQPLPTSMRDALARAGEQEIARIASQEPVARSIAPAASSSRSGLGWLAAVAASILAVVGWWPRLFPRSIPTLSQQRQAMLNTPGAIKIDWAKQNDVTAASLSGDIVWSETDDSGYIRLTGLSANDPAREQYQLWIFDESRGEVPVDGGVFDMPSGSTEAIIPIRAKLAVGKAVLFAVTVERSGGVVMTNKERMVAVAKE